MTFTPSFVHTSDLHIGECRTLDDYIIRHKAVLEQIINAAHKMMLPLIVSGDIHHTKKTNQEERFLVDWFIGTCERLRIDTIIIPGNHDHLYGIVNQLKGYANFPFKFVRIVTGPEPEVFVIKDTTFICVPWGDLTQEQIAETVSRFKDSYQSKYKVVVLHECVLGAKFDGGFLAKKGTKLPIIPDIDYWAIGDIHTSQMANIDNAWYPGAPLQFKFGDNLEKGYLIVDLNNPKKPEFVRTQFKPLLIVDSAEKAVDDAYYFVKGDIKNVLDSSKNSKIVRSEWVKPDSCEQIDHIKTDITSGLIEFLAENGLNEDAQKQALSWVEGVLNKA